MSDVIPIIAQVERVFFARPLHGGLLFLMLVAIVALTFYLYRRP